MLANFFRNCRMIVACDPENHTEGFRYALMDQQKIVATGIGSRETFGALKSHDILVGYFSTLSYLSKMTLPAAGREQTVASARHFIDEELLFNDAYELCIGKKERRGQSQEVHVLAVSTHEIEALSQSFSKTNRPLGMLTTFEVSVAALVNRVCPQPVQVLWRLGQRDLILHVEEGQVTFHRNQLAQEDIFSSADHWPGRPAIRLILGDWFKDEGFESSTLLDSDSQAVEAKLLKLFQFNQQENPRQILQHPELFGLPFVDTAWNLLSHRYQQEVRAYQYARWGVLAGGAAALMMAGLGVIDFLSIQTRQAELQAGILRLESEVADLKSVMPLASTLKNLEAYSQLAKKREEELRADKLLAWLQSGLPEGVLLRMVEFSPLVEEKKRGAPTRSSQQNVATGESDPLEKPPVKVTAKKMFRVHLEAVIAGNYFQTTQRVNAWINHLSKKGKLAKSTYTYHPPKADDSGDLLDGALYQTDLILEGKSL